MAGDSTAHGSAAACDSHSSRVIIVRCAAVGRTALDNGRRCIDSPAGLNNVIDNTGKIRQPHVHHQGLVRVTEVALSIMQFLVVFHEMTGNELHTPGQPAMRQRNTRVSGTGLAAVMPGTTSKDTCLCQLQRLLAATAEYKRITALEAYNARPPLA